MERRGVITHYEVNRLQLPQVWENDFSYNESVHIFNVNEGFLGDLGNYTEYRFVSYCYF